ncbi:MAG: right-handed parallel beta-helix repeat-containing protein, partial [Dehalococcoidia bacterium]
YLCRSHSNPIEDNYIHGNWHGIFIDGSDNNTIVYNTITENVLEESGVHVDANSSGNVANCNNIEDNGPYGVWNDPGNPTLDAENNFWGSADGPSTSPGTGDPVSANVAYDPWLPMEFQYCEECGGTPPTVPPRVPTTNQWGIVGLIILFTGLLLWTVWRKQLAS